MSTTQAALLPDDLAERLDELRRRVRLLTVLSGLGTVAAVAAVMTGTALMADLIWSFSGGVRFGVLAVVILSTAGMLWLTFLRPAFHKLSDAELAAIVEHASPQLHERLTSLVQIGETGRQVEHPGARLMFDLHKRETMKATRPLDFADSVSSSRAHRRLWWGAAAVLLLGVPLLLAPSSYGLLWARLLMPWGNFDSAANLYFHVNGGSRTVARGTDVVITAVPRWRDRAESRPQTVKLNVSGNSDRSDTRRMHYDEAAGSFVTTIPRVAASFDFTVSSGRSRSQSYHIEVVDRPQIVGVMLTVDPPSYTGRAQELHDGAIGNIAVFERSRLTFQLEFNKPLVKGDLAWLDGSPDHEGRQNGQPVPAKLRVQDGKQGKLPLFLSEDGRQATLMLTADRGGPYAFQVADEHGLRNANEPRRAIVVIRDQPPQLAVTGDHSETLQAGEPLRLAVRASDDVAVDAVELHYEVVDGESSQTVEQTAGDVAQISADAADLGGVSVSTLFELDPAGLDLPPGTRLKYRLRAADSRPVPGPNEVWSSPRQLIVPEDPVDALSAELARRREDLKQTLVQIRKEAVASRHTTVENYEHVEKAEQDKTTFEAAEALPPLSQRLLELSQRTEALALRFAEHPLFIVLAPDTQQVAREDLLPASDEIRQSIDAPPAEIKAALNETGEHLQSVRNMLLDLEKRFDKLAEIENDLLELNQLARLAEQLADEAASLEQRIRDLEHVESESRRAELNEELLAQQKALEQQRQQLAERLKDLFERRPELVEAALNSQLGRVAEISQEFERLAEREDLLKQAMSEERATVSRESGTREEPAKSSSDQKPNAESTAASGPQKDEQPLPDPKPSEQPAVRPDDDTFRSRLAQAKQRLLAFQAAEMALQVARQAGQESAALQRSAELARDADQAVRQSLAGRFDEAGKQAKAAAETANRVQRMLHRDVEQDKATSDLQQQLGDWAAQEQQLADEFDRLADSQPARLAAQQSGQKQLSDATDELSSELADIEQRLREEPLDAMRRSVPLKRARVITKRASQQMQSACNCLGDGKPGQAAQSAERAARLLRLAAKTASSAAGKRSQPGSPIPRDVADEVVRAARSLEQARQQLAQAGQQSKSSESSPADSSGDAQASTNQQGKTPAPADATSAKQSQASSNNEIQSDSAPPAEPSLGSFKQAAQALKQAAQHMQSQRSQASRGQPPGANEGRSDSFDTSETAEGATGTGARATVDYAQLQSRLEKLAIRPWGQIPGHLQTDIIQAAGGRMNSEYARLIKLYFREIAETQSANPNVRRSPAPRSTD